MTLEAFLHMQADERFGVSRASVGVNHAMAMTSDRPAILRLTVEELTLSYLASAAHYASGGQRFHDINMVV